MQGTLEWLKERQKGIGGSDVAAILGLNPFQSALDIYEQKIAENPIQIEENLKMKAGKRMENIIAKWYAEENNRKIQRRNDIIWHKEIPYLFVSLDRMIVMDKELTPGVLECKNTTSEYYKNWDPMPDYIMTQVQHELDVTGWSWAIVAALVDGWDFKEIPVAPDLKFIQKKNEKLESFWYDNVLKRIPPEPMSESDIKKLYPEIKTGQTLEVSEYAYNQSRNLIDVKNQIKELEEKEKAMTLDLKILLKNYEIATYQNKPIFTWKQSKAKTVVNDEKLKKLYPDVAEKVTDIVPGARIFLVKK